VTDNHSLLLFLAPIASSLCGETPLILSVFLESRNRTGSEDRRLLVLRRADVTADPRPYLALARGALVVRVLPGAAAVVDDARVAARLRMTRNRERGAVRRHLSCAGIVLAARATVALLGHGVRTGHRWTFHLPAVYLAVLQQSAKLKKRKDNGTEWFADFHFPIDFRRFRK